MLALLNLVKRWRGFFFLIPFISIFELKSDEFLRVAIFGDQTSLESKSVSTSYPDLLSEELLAKGINAQIKNLSVRGSHSGSILDNDVEKVSHAKDRFRLQIFPRNGEKFDLVVIQLGRNDAIEVKGGDTINSRIPLDIFRHNIEYFIEKIQSSGARIILVTPVPASSQDTDWQKNQTSLYASEIRKVSRLFGIPLVDNFNHVIQLTKLTSQPEGSWIKFSGVDSQSFHHFQADRIAAEIASQIKISGIDLTRISPPRDYKIPTIDLAGEKHRQIIVDKEDGQYLGHPTTLLLEDKNTILCVYPMGHGRGGIVYKKSVDAGLTWGERIPVPENWKTSKEVPTIHRVIDGNGKKRVIMWSGLYPARLAVSEDDGDTWSSIKPVGDWGGIVVMGCLFAQKNKPGHYVALFHDDGRFFTSNGSWVGGFTLFKTFSKDGGLTWSFPEAIYQGHQAHLCEPGVIRSPDGKSLAVLLRENSRKLNSHLIISHDEGVTWSDPKPLPASLTGDRHTGVYSSDGRLFISFRDTTLESPTKGDWVAWVGKFEDIIEGNEGQYRVRLMDNLVRGDCAYPGVEILGDDTIVTTTYGHWSQGEQPYIVSVRLKLSELDHKASEGLFLK